MIRWKTRFLVLMSIATLLLAACDSSDEAANDDPCADPAPSDVDTPGFLTGFDPSDGSKRWERHTGAVVGEPVSTGAAVAVQTRDGWLRAFDTADGRSLWCHDLGSPESSAGALPVLGAALAGETVVALDDTFTAQAFDMSSGRSLWSLALDVREGAALHSGVDAVYATVPGDDGGAELVALDAATGDRLWSAAASECAQPPCFTPGGSGMLADLGDTVVVADVSAGALRGIDTVDGTERWQAQIEGSPSLPMWAANDALVVQSAQVDEEDDSVSADVVAIEKESGETRWTAPGTAFLAVDDPTVALLDQGVGTGREPGQTSDLDAEAVALSLEDGSERWRRTVPGTPEGIAVTGDLVIAVDRETLTAFDADSGEERWRVTHPTPATTDRFSQPGSYRGLQDSGDTVVAVIAPEEPYDD